MTNVAPLCQLSLATPLILLSTELDTSDDQEKFINKNVKSKPGRYCASFCLEICDSVTLKPEGVNRTSCHYGGWNVNEST